MQKQHKYTMVLVALFCAGLLTTTSSDSLAEEPMEPAEFCEMSLEEIESEIAEDLAAGIITQAEAEFEMEEEIEDLEFCSCFWSELLKLTNAQYVLLMQKYSLNPPSLEEIQEKGQQGLLNLPNGLDEDEVEKRIESVCGPLD